MGRFISALVYSAAGVIVALIVAVLILRLARNVGFLAPVSNTITNLAGLAA